MADLKVTKMMMKVDLQCSKCYRKIKKVLCHFPQIRNQEYDEKKNTVTITVCCSPENIKQKIACKAGDTVESIEIIPDKEKVVSIEPSATPTTRPTAPPSSTPTTPPTAPPTTRPTAPPLPVVLGFPPTALPLPAGQGFPCPVCVCCCCYRGGPCYHGRGPKCYDGCGRPGNECSGCNRDYYVCRCYEYFSEENASGCSVM